MSHLLLSLRGVLHFFFLKNHVNYYYKGDMSENHKFFASVQKYNDYFISSLSPQRYDNEI